MANIAPIAFDNNPNDFKDDSLLKFPIGVKLVRVKGCGCKGLRKCTTDKCSNFFQKTECQSRCACGNRKFSKTRKVFKYAVQMAGDNKGWGLFATKRIEAGEFIIAYVGDVITKEEKDRRFEEYKNRGIKHNYMIQAGKYHIDPTFYGNKARFANHCCDPNVIVEKWTMDRAPQGFKALAFVACKPIEEGQEITFNYKFDYNKENAQPCHCDAGNKCNKWIGKAPPKN
ncbi:hypothetical protein CRE_00038 [Caenorhabditis remanei]|uniref:SET domain-containing protein n=1 Tax=Caenorhabditis remanei TaxID=31234 RepID=E3LCK3_CAERE|nr:hypothetical protein CRE_00038 [Caenorhabditis remanei]